MTSSPISRADLSTDTQRGPFVHMAIAAGLAATALYLAHPILQRLASEFGLTSGQASWLVTGAQLGYTAGLLLLVPLGDVLRSRGLAIVLLLLTAAGLILTTMSVSGPMMITATAVSAMCAVGAQVLVPMAASIAPEGRTGRAVGTVMAGVLFGGLAGRAVSGMLADLVGWRSGYWLIAIALIITTLTLRHRLPYGDTSDAALTPARYPGVLRSLITPFRALPVLRRLAIRSIGRLVRSAYSA